ncbi:MAG: hypothetical protein JSW28_09125 [Thermoplasmata archaeon]|nr:MAG: hypothetical protein JSW28_09125 [Thermoplasmata archaeon]
MHELVIWVGIFLFIGFILAAAFLYFQSEKVDEKYKKSVELIRAIKKRKLKDHIIEFHGEEFAGMEGKIAEEKERFPSEEDFRELQIKMQKSSRNLNTLMKKAADLKMWFDYLPRAKEFLVAAALWTFLIGLATLAFCLSVWVELTEIGHIQYSGYLSFLWIFMGIRFFKNILRYNMVTKNINEHMDKLRDEDIESF